MKCLSIVFLVSVCFFSCKEKKVATNKDEWVLQQRSVYKNVLTKEGYLDTSYGVKYIFNDGDLTDSLKGFIDYNYQDEKLAHINYFSIDKSNKPVFTGKVEFTYTKNGKVLTTSKHVQGKLVNWIEYEYDTAGREKKFKNIMPSIASIDNDDNIFESKPIDNFSYDTTIVNYEYDTDSRVSKITTTDLRNSVIRRDVNFYTGADPLYSFSVTPNGDTVQKIGYRKEGKTIKMTISNEASIVTRWSYKNWLFGTVTEDIKTRQKRKLLNKYDQNGKMIEQTVYITSNSAK